ncbi:MAG: LEA type 2 family protein [Pseudomonadota bacterium]|nr:LEA type 2 family protein [Pseudomonadota bacterium]
MERQPIEGEIVEPKPSVRDRLRGWLIKQVRRFVKTPEITITGLQAKEVSLFEQRFCLTIRIHNPNRIALPVKVFRYRVELMGRRFAKGENVEAFKIPARDAVEFDVNAKLSMARLAGSLATFLLQGEPELNYRIRGDIDVGLPLIRNIPFSYGGRVDFRR